MTKLITRRCPLCKKEIYSLYPEQLEYNFNEHRTACLRKHNLLKTDKAFIEKTKQVGFPR